MKLISKWKRAKQEQTRTQDPSGTVEIYPSVNDADWRFRVKANNGRNLDPEGHSDPRDAWRAAMALRAALERPRLIIKDHKGDVLIEDGS